MNELFKLDEIWMIFINKPLISALIAQVSSQIFKIFLPLFRGGKINIKKFMHYGDIPSAHTAFIASLTFSIGFNSGWGSPLFAGAVVISGIVIYDILKLRKAVEISLTNTKTLMDKEGLKPEKKSPQFKGHSPVEVITGIIWGLIIAVVIQIILT